MQYIVLGRSNGTTRMGSPYCSLKIKSLEEELSIAVWDVAPDDPPIVGQLVSFVRIQNNDGKCSARKAEMQPGAIADPSHPLYGFIPRPIGREAWDRTIANLLTMCDDEQLRTMIGDVATKLYQPYSQYPAASSIHHAFRGGLLNHVYQMLHMLEGLLQICGRK